MASQVGGGGRQEELTEKTLKKEEVINSPTLLRSTLLLLDLQHGGLHIMKFGLLLSWVPYPTERGVSVIHDCCSVAQSCPILCDPVDCSKRGFPVLDHLSVCSNSCPLSQ